MKIKITYDKGGIIVEREFESEKELDLWFTDVYVKINVPEAKKCLFMVKAERFISAERIEE